MSVLFTLDPIVNPIILVIAVAAGAIAGLGICRAKVAKSASKLKKLEAELLQSNEETLEYQRAYAELESRMHNQSIPVISMKINGNKENPKEKATK